LNQGIYEPNWEFCKIETAHNSLQLERRGSFLELRDPAGRLQSRIDPNEPQRLIMENLELLVSVILFIPPPRKILLLGTAAGSLLHFFRNHYPAQIVAVDIDAELISQLQKLEVLPDADDRLAYETQDAFHFVDNCAESYDLILFDIFDGGQSPAWILERDNLHKLYRLLSPEGALALNLLIDSDSDFSRFYRNLQSVCAQ
jgi:spermidine synthase